MHEMIEQFIEENYPRTLRYHTEDEGNIVGLPHPYSVSGLKDIFREMYYWGTYFANVGLLASGEVAQAKNNVDNLLYLAGTYGFVPNCNNLNNIQKRRSQPPFLYQAVKDVYDRIKDDEWLARAYAIIAKEYHFWQTERLAPNGLNIYGNHSSLTAEEQEIILRDYRYRTEGKLTVSDEDAERIAHTTLALWESGWDFTSRFGLEGEYYNPVCLNALLYGLETTMAAFSRILHKGEETLWLTRAGQRRDKMDALLWDAEAGVYTDWNFKEERLSPVHSVASLYPLFVSLSKDTQGEQALLQQLMVPYGVAATVEQDYAYVYQWDYPGVWPPLQYIVYVGCLNYGLTAEAAAIRDRYVAAVETTFRETQMLWEKYDGITAKPFDIEYPAQPLMGWTAQLYQYFKATEE